MIEILAIGAIITIGAAFAKESRTIAGKSIAIIICLCLFVLMLL